MLITGGKALKKGSHQNTEPYQTLNTGEWNLAVSQWGISFIGERETSQTIE